VKKNDGENVISLLIIAALFQIGAFLSFLLFSSLSGLRSSIVNLLPLQDEVDEVEECFHAAQHLRSSRKKNTYTMLDV
jgi:hypothetical protein